MHLFYISIVLVIVAIVTSTTTKLLNELQSCGINTNNIDIQQIQRSLPSSNCNDPITPSIDTHGYMTLETNMFINSTQLHTAIKTITYTPSRSHIAERFSPRLGGDGHRIESYKSTFEAWGKDAIQNNTILQDLNIRNQLWINVIVPFQKIDPKVVASTDVLFSFLPKITGHSRGAHSCSSSKNRPHLLYKVLYFVHDVTNTSNASNHTNHSIRLRQYERDCTYDVAIERNQLLIVDCSKIEMEIESKSFDRYMIVQWLRGFTGFGVQ
mgnify:CR=1 FL=1